VVEREWSDALAAGSAVLMQQKVTHLKQLRMRAVMRRPEFWIGFFDYLVTLHAEQSDTRVVRTLIEQGRLASSRQDWDSLRNVCFQLRDLLPSATRATAMDAFGATGIRA
jgi:hypothetical protein